MRRVVSSAVVALGLVGAGLAVGAVPAMAAGKKVCTIQDERLGELSGLVASGSGYITINDSTDRSSEERIFYLSGKCGVSKNVQYSGDGPRDTEDLALSPNGKTLWIADIGDNPDSNPRRTSVALWSMPVDGSKRPTIHRLAYPDRKPHDAEALLMGGDNVPIIITKTGSKAELFSPAAALKANNETPVAMKKVGEVTLPKTTTDNPFGAIGRLMVTGAARAPDGSRVVLRTYADAFEYDVADGDVVKALTTGEPRVTALDSDQFGESIAYSADGKSFLTVSDLGTLEDGASNDLFRYTPSQAAPKSTVAASAGDSQSGDGRSWIDELTLRDITYMIGAVGVLGALLVGAGVFGILRARRSPPADPAGAKVGASGDDGGDGPTVGRRPVPGAAGVAAVASAAVASAAVVDDRQAGYDESRWDRRPGGYDDGYRSDYPPANDYQPADNYQPAGQTYGTPSRPSGGSGAVYGARPGGGGRGGVYGSGGGGDPGGGGPGGGPGGGGPGGGGGGAGGVYGGGQYRSGAQNGATPGGVYGQPKQPPGYPDGTW